MTIGGGQRSRSKLVEIEIEDDSESLSARRSELPALDDNEAAE